MPDVSAAQLSYTYEPDVTPTDPGYTFQWAHPKTQAPLAWDSFTGDPSVVVAIIGTGIDRNHPDLDANLWVNSGEIAGNGIDDDANGFVDDTRGWDFYSNDNDPTWTAGGDPHETEVAGVLGGEANNGIGGAGVLWSTSIMNLRVAYTSSNVSNAIYYAVDNGAKVINMSFGSYDPTKYGPDSIVGDAIEYASAQNVVVVATAGNDNITTQRFPGAHPLVLGVGATASDDTRSTFSNYGDWVDVAAPGTSIYTTSPNGGYASVSGTSFSAPYVAGIAAGLRSMHPTWSEATIRQVIEYSGDKIATDQFIGSTRAQMAKIWSATGLPSVFARIKSPYSLSTFAGPTAVFGTAIGSSFTLEVRPQGGTTWAQLNTGGSTIDGTLGTLDVAAGSYELRLSVTDFVSSDSDTIVVTRTDVLPGWPVPVYGSPWAPIAVGDIDGIPGNEVVWADNSYRLQAVHADGSALPGFPLVMPSYFTYGAPALGDIDGNGDIEIVMTSFGDSSTTGHVMVYNHDGTTFAGWPKALGPTYGAHGSPLLVDLDADGKPEIVSVEYGSKVHAWNAAGNELPGFPVTLSAAVSESSPLAADLNGDGFPEIVVATSAQLYVLNRNGTIASGWPQAVSSGFAEMAIADLDGDGTKEIVIGHTTGVRAYRPDGTLLQGWNNTIAGSTWRRFSAGDFDGDGKPEVVVGTNTGSIYILGANGAPLSGWPQSVGADVRGSAIADVDGDGAPDVVLTVNNQQVYAFHANGTAVQGFPKLLPGNTANATPLLADIDSNGLMDLVVGTTVPSKNMWAKVLSGSRNPFLEEWTFSRHDPYNTGLYARKLDLTVAPHGTRVSLSWSAPESTSSVKSYAVYRDLQLIGNTTQRTFDDPAPVFGSSVTYGVIGLDETKNVRVQSMQVSTVAGGASSGCTQSLQSCSDANACTSGETCDVDLFCGGGAPVSCTDGNVCTTDSCDPATGCTFTANTAACDDGNACTTGDTCSGGACQAGTATSCDDGNVCTDDSCNPAAGCIHTPNAISCNDGNACTTGDVCAAGTCQAGTAVSCDDGNSCTTDSCNPATGCVATNNTNACDDNNACTTGDVCAAGTCQAGTAVSCNDGNSCTTDSCNPATGCVATNNTNACDDNNACTTGDVCSAGTCQAGMPVSCDDGDACTTDSCNTGSGCTHTLQTVPFFDTALQVQHCCGSTCSVGTSLISPRVAEPNTPNTLLDGCADGTSSSQPEHNVRSIAISGTIARNTTVTFQVGYQCKENSDWVDVYYAPSAQSPIWTLIDKVRCTGASTVTSNFAKLLANQGGDHAVRAQLRHIGNKYTQAMCPSSNYDDHDDVVFRVP